jgi:hypothetical protein
MSGWIWVVLVLGLLLSIGLVTDWRRRHSGGGSVDNPGTGSHPGGTGHTGGHGCGGGCGGGSP